MNLDKSLFAVLLKDESQLQWGPIAQALASYKKVPALDTALEAKKCWGFVGENLSREKAEALVLSLLQFKIESFVVSQEKIPALSPALVVDSAQFAENQLTLTTDSGAEHSIPWENVGILGSAAFNSSISRKVIEKQGPSGTQQLLNVGLMLATGLPIKIGPKKKTLEKNVTESNLSFVLDILTKGTSERFRIFPDDFNFSFLQDRMVHGAMGNFLIFLKDLAARTPQASRSRGTRIFVSGQMMANMGYETLADLEKETRWLIAI